MVSTVCGTTLYRELFQDDCGCCPLCWLPITNQPNWFAWLYGLSVWNDCGTKCRTQCAFLWMTVSVPAHLAWLLKVMTACLCTRASSVEVNAICDFPLSILVCGPPRFACIGSVLMKSLLKQALAQCQFTNVTKDSNSLQSADERKKQKSLTRNRRAGQLKRLRNERYKRSHRKPQSWRAVQTKKRSKLKPVSRNPVTESKGIDPKLKSLAQTIVQSRRLLFGNVPKRVCPKKPDSVLFAEKKFRDYGRKVKDIVCS
ncbi:hypothetical protein P879_06453 [Paragonimus westermani]|uniref:Uncharacterized protein n=1 Tax=Paragonimus westermani TaxID=34504 RepID=A0A8T0DHY7_9TREM|nr:hypothetical protein P879_06453 [Paragonimus westermani]